MPRHIDYEPGIPVTVRTGESVVIRVPGGSATVAIHAPMAVRSRQEYPACTLESTDGTYRRRLTAKDDLVPSDDWLQLRFHGLPTCKRFTLRFEAAPDVAQILMEDVPYESIVDGEHTFHDGHLFGSAERQR
ncbi:MAG: hypothetical protein WCC48_17630 [Anaeromyxobacteraceae bacterium]